MNCIDLYKTSGVHSNALKILPKDKKQLNKIVIGDDQGLISILEGESLDSKYQVYNKEITRIEFGQQPTGEKDRIIYAQGSHVIGLTRKLKEYLKFDSQLVDPIRHIQVEDTNLYLCTDYLLNIYNMINDQVMYVNFYMCPDKIKDIRVDYLSGQTKIYCILGCQDSCVRVTLEDKLIYDIRMESPVQCIEKYKERTYVFGMDNGMMRIIEMKLNGGINLMKIESSSGISSIKCFENSMMVGRNDGVIELYENNQLKYQKKLYEGITNIEVGNIKSQLGEFVVSTFSGRILLIKESEENLRKGLDLKSNDKKQQQIQENKIKQLKQEINKLESQYQELRQKGNSQGVFKINEKIIRSQEGFYKWIIDSQVPLDKVSLNSTVDIEILNEDAQQYENNALIKVNGNKNIEISFRTQEGKQGELICYLIYDKYSQMIKTNIKGLNLHQKVEQNLKGMNMHKLNLNGQFTKNDMNMWINQLIPDLPVIDEETVNYTFQNVLTKNYLMIKYKNKQALIKSDCVSTINICKQLIVDQANLRSIQIDVKWDLNEEALLQQINEMQEKMIQLGQLEQKIKMLPALKELQIQEQDCLSNELQQILTEQEVIQQQYKKQQYQIDYLTNRIIDMQQIEYNDVYSYKSKCQLKGSIPNQNRIEQIQSTVNKLQFNDLTNLLLT